MFDLRFYNMISKANKLIDENYKELYQAYSHTKRGNRYDIIDFLKENRLYLREYSKYFFQR